MKQYKKNIHTCLHNQNKNYIYYISNKFHGFGYGHNWLKGYSNMDIPYSHWIEYEKKKLFKYYL